MCCFMSFCCLKTCPVNQARDTIVIDGEGNYIQCKCASGFFKTNNDCSNVSLLILVYSCFMNLLRKQHW